MDQTIIPAEKITEERERSASSSLFMMIGMATYVNELTPEASTTIAAGRSATVRQSSASSSSSATSVTASSAFSDFDDLISCTSSIAILSFFFDISRETFVDNCSFFIFIICRSSIRIIWSTICILSTFSS